MGSTSLVGRLWGLNGSWMGVGPLVVVVALHIFVGQVIMSIIQTKLPHASRSIGYLHNLADSRIRRHLFDTKH